jgi:Tfp pilus assembly protein PilE
MKHRTPHRRASQAALAERRPTDQRGTTLIELMLVCVVVGTIAGIAVHAYAAQRVQAFNSRAASDVAKLATAMDVYFAVNNRYPSCSSSSECEARLLGFRVSPGVSIAAASEGTAFTATASHPLGDRVFSWDSANGGLKGAP